MTRSASALLAALLVLATAPASRAAVVSFDDLAPSGTDGPGTTVTTAYAAQGVTFAGPRAFDYTKGSQPLAGFAHSPNVAVEPCVAGDEFCTDPVRADFAAPQQRVRVWVGFSSRLRNPTGIRLTAYDAAGKIAATADATLPANTAPTPIRTPLTVDLPAARIRRIDVGVSTANVLSIGLAVDDVEFSTATPTATATATATATPATTANPTPAVTASPCAVAAPAVTLTAPADGTTVTSGAVGLSGTVDGHGAAITAADVLVDGRASALFPQIVGAGGGPFGIGSYAGLLTLGLNQLAVRAATCAGSATSALRRVIRAVPQPGPMPDACPLQLDDPAVHVATDAADLAATLRGGFRGQVIVASDMDLTGSYDLPLRPGVQLVGARGELGRRPILHSDIVIQRPPTPGDDHGYAMFEAGPGVCVEGLDLRGPTASHSKGIPDMYAFRVIEDPAAFHAPGVRPFLVADSELHRWPGAAVFAQGTVAWDSHVAPPGYTGPKMNRGDADLVRVERNYIHHNARDGGGYGVVVGASAYVRVTGNVFDYNRHDVASDGASFSGYIARYNYSQQGGFQYGDAPQYWGQHYDVHGTLDEPHYIGGIAGEYAEIAYNTVRGIQAYHCGLLSCQHRHALELRGRPTDGLDFTDNVLAAEAGEAVIKRGGADPGLQNGADANFNLRSRDNHFDTDYSSRLAAGDFDGDGRTDVLLSDGTAWFFSRAGRSPWEFLGNSSRLTGDLGFADIDNDGRTDVLYRTAAGAIRYVSSGAGSDYQPLTTAPVPMPDLRFGDFDGDGLTDMFYTRFGQWHVWYGRTRAWTATQTSVVPLTRLAVGEFDGTRGTDVLASRSGGWFVSAGATAAYTRVNARLADAFGGAVVADFDADGRSDVAFDDDGTWRFSRGGRGPLQRLRRAAGAVGPLDRLLVGHFDGQPRPGVLAYGAPTSNRLTLWRGLGGQADFATWAPQNQR